ncbi:MAG TPA: hypothetical protein VMU83_13000, partial [Hanamia sp.]|nr:hypothetical protein [Hanamia sp.]
DYKQGFRSVGPRNYRRYHPHSLMVLPSPYTGCIKLKSAMQVPERDSYYLCLRQMLKRGFISSYTSEKNNTKNFP